MRRILLFTFFILFLLLPKRVFAEDFVIDKFDSQIFIRNSGVVEISENLDIDFSSNQKHGIFRDLPVAYQNTKGMVYSDIEVSDVMRNGVSEKFEVIRNNNNLRIKIGDPNKTVSNKQRYSIDYSVNGVLASYEESNEDELYWNVTGNNWDTMIYNVTARVKLEKPGLIDAKCYYGSAGSTTECKSSIVDERNVQFSSVGLSSFEGVSIVATYNKGLFPIIKVAPPEKYPFLKMKYLIVFLITTVIGVVAVLNHWYKKGRDIWSPVPILLGKNNQGRNKPIGTRDNITVEFEPPEGLRPAEIGVLMDERADTLDVSATLIDLATRGFLHINEIEKSWAFGKSDYELVKSSKETSKLLSYESSLLNHLFSGRKSVKLSELKLTFYDELKLVKAELYKNVVEKGFFPEDPEQRRNNLLIIAVIVAFASFFLIFNLLNNYYFVSFMGGILLSAITLMLFSRSMSRRSVLGSDLYRRSLGFRLFISGAEKYRQQFYERKNMLNDILPYTIVFGLTGKFANAMEKMGIKSDSPSWYTGTHPFAYSSFATNVNSFSTSLSNAISSAPSSSGSSGGSSGGGFGGGGGGSW